jgi:TonB family protein
MRLFAAALLVVVLPAFGQDVREQTAARLHDSCVALTQESLEHEISIKVEQSIDMQKFCVAADEQIREDRLLESLARQSDADLEPSSGLMVKLRSVYYLGGLQRYWKMMGWPQRAANQGARSVDEIRIAIERRKGAIYADYNRALKDKPTLAGKVVVEFTVEPSGQVTDVSIRSSDLTDAAFLSALKLQIEALKFPAEPVRKLVAKYPIDFIPH